MRRLVQCIVSCAAIHVGDIAYSAAYAQITLQRKLLSINGYMDRCGVPRMWLFAEETVSPRVDKRANSAKPGV